ncbi:MAG TPA: hypothetical protein VGR18_04325 [Rubrobacter sp.]|nr:hypothetical protein [Rubrobacter sp.]
MRANSTNKRQITDTPRAFEYGADWQSLPEITPTSGANSRLDLRVRSGS